jgi:hypothetical protein
MRNYLLGGIAIASVFALMIPSAPASAQGGCGIGHPCNSHRVVGAGPAQLRYQHHGYAHGYGRGNGYGYGVGVGVGAAAAGVIIGGAMEQNQGYDPAESYPVYSDQSPPYDDASPQLVNDGDSIAYCQQTYRSYDPASGTYLGYDGLRHPCP